MLSLRFPIFVVELPQGTFVAGTQIAAASQSIVLPTGAFLEGQHTRMSSRRPQSVGSGLRARTSRIHSQINTAVEAGLHMCIRKTSPSAPRRKTPPGVQKELFNMNILSVPEQIEGNYIHYIPITVTRG